LPLALRWRTALGPGSRLAPSRWPQTRVLETNIYYPTDGGLLRAGVRRLTRVMKQVTAITGPARTTLRDRTRSVKLRLLAIGRASRNKSGQGTAKWYVTSGQRVPGERPPRQACDPR